MNQVIDTYYGKINLNTSKSIDDIRYFINTFLPYGINSKLLFTVEHNESIKTNISISGNEIYVNDNWSKGIPNSFIIFLNHLLAKYIYNNGDLMFHGGMIFNEVSSKGKLIIGDSGSGKTSSILNLISKYENIYYLSNTKSIIGNNGNISYLAGTNVISVRKLALSYYSKKILDLLDYGKIYENDDWLYSIIKDKLLTSSYYLDSIYNVKISSKNICKEIIDNKEKIFILLGNISHSNVPIVFNENYIYFLNYLENINNINILSEIVKKVKLYNIEGGINFITKNIYEL